MIRRLWMILIWGISDMKIICIKCELSRFPEPKEQCYVWGGLICTVDGANVGKYDPCRFPEGTAVLRENDE